MSTTNPTSRNGQHTALPSFISINHNLRRQSDQRFSYAESSNASSSRSAAGRSETRRSTSRNGDGVGRSDDGSEKDNGPRLWNGHIRSSTDGSVDGNGHAFIHRTKRTSGGFLLESSPNSSRLSRSILSPKAVRSISGKEKPNTPTFSLSKRRARVDAQGSSPSLRASPLSSEVRSSPVPYHQDTYLRNEHNGSGSRPVDGSLRSNGSTSTDHNNSSYGFDTDPAQIVDMALRLNEGRRRLASSRRLVSGSTTLGEGMSMVWSNISTMPKDSLARHVGPYGSIRSSNKRSSFQPEPTTPQKRQRGNTGSSRISPIITEDLPLENGLEDDSNAMQISRATQNRIAKAKQYFELAYEHRRLLSHLPPIRRPDAPHSSADHAYDSKSYNPLQYARNRKLRFRERAPINSEAEGWHDVEKVRMWVDAVVHSHSATKHTPLECLRLPPLTLVDEEAKNNDEDSDAAAPRPAQQLKPRRPRSDWVTHPGDLIADAFWTEQGLNKQKIYNRDNEPVFPLGTKFQFSGWRNQTPPKIPTELKQSSPESELLPVQENHVPIVAPPALPNFESAHKDNNWTKKRSKFSKALKKGPRLKKSHSRDSFSTSSESESTDGTEDGKERGRKRSPRRRHKLALPDGDPFAPRIEPANPPDDEVDSSGQSRQDSMRDSLDGPNPHIHSRHHSSSNSAVNDDDAEKRHLRKRRNFLHSFRLDSDDKGRSSLEYDSTAPATPIGYGFPSIAINLSPPESRNVSPTRKHKQSILDAVKDKMHPHKEKGSTDHIDFAKEQDSNLSSKHASGRLLKHLPYELTASRGQSPMSRGTSPFTKKEINRSSVDESPGYSTEVRESISKVSTRTDDSKTAESGHHRAHRVRGMFKGGRIAELVGHEVSRVGDFIWKREPPKGDSVDGGSVSGYESDSDEMMDPRDKHTDTNRHQDVATPATPDTHVDEAAPPIADAKRSDDNTPRFHIQGLPSFTSPFEKDKKSRDKESGLQSPGGTLQHANTDQYDSDPVSTAARRARVAGKSPRLGRLAPPRLDIRAATPDGRRMSYGFGAALDVNHLRSAPRHDDSASNNGSQKSLAHERPGLGIAAGGQSSQNLNRSQSHRSGRSSPQPPRNTNMHDFARTRALLLITTIKATNIQAFCDNIPQPQSSFLYSVFETTGASGSEINKRLPAPRKDEHTVAARHLIGHLNNQSNEFNDCLSNFTQTTTANLHREIQILEDNAESELFPRLQKLSDQAGQLAQKLTTTSTLAVRSVNDDVAEAMRMKRRGPYRIVRAFGFKLIECGVVGLLWLIWFVAMVVRSMITSVKAVWRFIAWLCFLR